MKSTIEPLRSWEDCVSTATAEPSSRQSILLEAGTNELEVLVFSLGPTRYGVNVAKVREVIGQVKSVRVPKTHSAVVGVFKLREKVISLIDLQLYFDPGKPSQSQQRSVILMEFNNLQVGFLVDHVERIYRVGWSTIKPMPGGQGDSGGAITSICDLEDGLVLMVDFEKIAFDVGGRSNAVGEDHVISSRTDINRGSQHILLAEDSPTIRQAILSVLNGAGYRSLVPVCNGKMAWSEIERTAQEKTAKPFTVVITDIEMPEMDGLCLCKHVKEDRRFKHLPVIVFSSLISESNLEKCRSVGADAAITKPQIARLVELLDAVVLRTTSPDAKNDVLVLKDPGAAPRVAAAPATSGPAPS
jgi:two-component system chemotaxis response regulator CheV